MENKEKLKMRLDLINNQIKKYKEIIIKEIEREEMVLATSNLLMLRGLKEQQLLLCKILDEEI